MATRGTEAKAKVTKAILRAFTGSFVTTDGKELRIPVDENGDLVQVKVTLTAAKVNIDPSGGPMDTSNKIINNNMVILAEGEDKARVKDILARLGL